MYTYLHTRARLDALPIYASGTPTTAWSNMASFAAGDGKVAYSADGKTIATVVQDFTHAPAVYAGSAAAPRQITHDNDDLAPAMGARSIRWKKIGRASCRERACQYV